jgi:hypothetical protein
MPKYFRSYDVARQFQLPGRRTGISPARELLFRRGAGEKAILGGYDWVVGRHASLVVHAKEVAAVIEQAALVK